MVDFRYTTTGRVLSRDPMGMVDSYALHQFVSNNPIIHTDPTGKKVDSDGMANCGEWKKIMWGWLEDYTREKTKNLTVLVLCLLGQ